MRKFGNIKDERISEDGSVKKFDSKKEARRFDELMLLQRAGVIKDLLCQPEYELQPSFKCNGKTIRAIAYRGDFYYVEVETDQKVVEDVKSPATRTALFEVKMKIMLYRYPETEFRVYE